MARESIQRAGDSLQTVAPSFRAGDVVISCEPWVWSFKYEQHKLLCAECFRESQNLRVCSSCKLYRYCDERCQVASWKRDHKHECGMLKTIRTKYNQLENHESSHAVPNLESKLVDQCAAEILVAKAICKFQRGDKYKLSKSNIRLSAGEVAEVLPYDSAYEESFRSTVLGSLKWATAEIGNIPNFDALLRKIFYNVFPVWDPQGKLDVIAAGVFPEALEREMTPVCWDTNVTMDLQGRTLVVRATKDIVNYTGLKDLRQNELAGSNFVATLKERRMKFDSLYRRPCTCCKCTPEYDAEINPLKCSTSGCTERIPSDVRALQPCPQCGVINGDRLYRLTKLKEQYETIVASPIQNGMVRTQQLTSFFWELHQADVLQPDAHFRFACGFGVFNIMDPKRYEETWNICCGMVACIRAVYPKYHLNRASWLLVRANICLGWYLYAVKHHEKHSGAKLQKCCSEAVEWLKESREIYSTVSGKGSKWERHVSFLLHQYAKLPFQISLMVGD